MTTAKKPRSMSHYLNFEQFENFLAGRDLFISESTLGSVTVNRLTHSTYISLYMRGWCPIALDTKVNYMLDRNVLIDIQQKRGDYEIVVAKLKEASDIRLDLALLEGGSRKPPTFAGFIKEHEKYKVILTENGIKRVAPFNKQVVHAFASKLAVRSNETLLMSKFHYSGPIHNEHDRLEALHNLHQLAQQLKVQIDSGLFMSLASTYYKKPKNGFLLNNQKIKKAGKSAGLSGYAMLAYNLKMDMFTAWALAAVWRDISYKYVTRDEALARIILSNQYTNENHCLYDSEHIFPGLSSAEENFFKTIGFAL